jgi:hypothetical protein
VFRKCEAGKNLPDAGHGENEDKEPELPLPEHEAGFRGLAGPVQIISSVLLLNFKTIKQLLANIFDVVFKLNKSKLDAGSC